MKRVKLFAITCATALLTVITLSAGAQDFNTNERTYLTFSNTVELPGVTLQPGTYLFKLADSASNRHIVQVLSQDEKHIYATILAVPAERQEVSGETVVTFKETAENTTPAVQYWYYPGDRIGQEFVYPKDQAMKIAQRTGQTVLSTEGEVASSDSKVSSIGPDGRVTDWEREGTPARTAEHQTSGTVTGTTGVSQMPQSAQHENETVNPAEESQNPETETPPAEPATAAQATRPQPPAATGTRTETTTDTRAVGTSGQADTRELPRTASPLPLSGLIGLLSIGGAAILRRARK